VLEGPPPTTRHPDWVKVTMLLKRRPGLSLAEYRERMLGSYAPTASKLPGLRRYLQCQTRDGAYVFGEASFDGVEQLWFDDVDAARAALDNPYFANQVWPALSELVDPKYVFSMVAREDWVIAPDIPKHGA
jgi:hypothetical protein